jgi:glucan phosphoethanolaminetransferase (alkaline phosphatase superfamily)
MTTTSLVKSQLLKTNIIYNLFFIDKLKKEELDKINKFFIEKENELNKEIKYTNKKEKIEEPNKIYFFFLESIRRDYLKEMLFLKEIEENSIIFKNNYSSYSGTDYTVLSSLYGEKIFTLKKNKKNIKPIISNFKEKGYNLEHYQPQTIKTFPFYFKNSLDFLKENGKVYGADEIETISTFYKDEEKTINKMINNSIKNKGKEILVYLSYINHFPYFTYEKDMEYYPNKEKSFEQYKKSIKKMDNILINTIKRIKKEQPTAMMIFVPDHGQAFGEKGRYTHGFNDNEVIDNQVYIYHKDITKNIITENTSHYNILPTVYDTMYGTTSKNSIYNDFSKYITIFSNQELTLINNRLNIKETLLYNKSCKRFDLFKDQKELNQLECKELKQFQK